MNKKNILMAVTTLFLMNAVNAAAIKSVPATQIILRQYSLPANAQTVSGRCWTNSIASFQPNAWRCMVNNTIYDPCFTTDVKNKLVCNIDPKNTAAAFILQLTAPLPAVEASALKSPHPWLLQLADGTLCRPYTGTTPLIGKFAVPYYCDDSPKLPSNCHTGLIENSMKSGKTWTVQQVIYCAPDKSMNVVPKKIQTVPIKIVWP